jgi:putative ABC transport system substrate-binding protein
LTELGLREGEHVGYEYRNVEGKAEQLPGALASLLNREVDLILAIATPAARAAAGQAARPVVFAPVFDPVGAGLVKEAGRPGGLVTGVSGMIPGDRKLERLAALFPGCSEVTVLFNPGDPNSPAEVRSLEAAGAARGVAVRRVEVRDRETLTARLPEVLAEAQVLLLSLDRLTDAELEGIADAACRAKKPLVAHNAAGVRRGALVALEADPVQLGRRAASLAFRIFNGADPAQVPVEFADDALLILNAAVAKGVGYHLPPSLTPDDLVQTGRGA